LRQPSPPLFPYTTLFRSRQVQADLVSQLNDGLRTQSAVEVIMQGDLRQGVEAHATTLQQKNLGGRVHATNLPDRPLARPVISSRDRKSTRLNSSHVKISY